MKKISIILVISILFVSMFSMSAFAAEPATKTDAFFSTVYDTKGITLVGLNTSGAPGFSVPEMSARVTTDENGKSYMEMVGSAKFAFFKLDLFALKDGLYMYFPQFNRHMDYSFIYKDMTDELVSDFTAKTIDLFLPIAYVEYLTLESAGEEHIENYGTAYVERFSYNKDALINDLVRKGLIPNPKYYNVNIYDENEIIEFVYNYAQDDTAYKYAKFLSEDFMTFAYNENDDLVYCNYYVTEGDSVRNVVYDYSLFECIKAGADNNKFVLPESSLGLEIFELLAKLVYSMFS